MMRVLVIAAVLLTTLFGCKRQPPQGAAQPAPVPTPAVAKGPTGVPTQQPTQHPTQQVAQPLSPQQPGQTSSAQPQQTSSPQPQPKPQPVQSQEPSRGATPQHAGLVVDARLASIRQNVVDATCSPFLPVVLHRDQQPNLVVDDKGRISHGTATAKTGDVDIEQSFQLRRLSVPEGFWMLQISPRGNHLQEFIGAAQAPVVRDAEGNEYAPFGTVVDDKDLHYVDIRPLGEGIAAIPQPPTGPTVDLCLLYRVPVGRVVAEAVIDRQVVFQFSPPLDDHSQ